MLASFQTSELLLANKLAGSWNSTRKIFPLKDLPGENQNFYFSIGDKRNKCQLIKGWNTAYGK